MTEAAESSEIWLRIPGQIEWLDLIDRVANGIAEQYAFSEEEGDGIANSVIEAGTNAIQHGHRFDASQPVEFRFSFEGQALTIQVSDRGPGFDVEKVLMRAAPTTGDSLLAPRGRGIFIMKSLMDEVSFEITERGCTAILTKLRRNGRG